MNESTVIQVIHKLIGDIEPKYKGTIDSDSLKNLKVYIEVLKFMYQNVMRIYRQHSDSQDESVKVALDEIRKIYYIIEECQKNLDIEPLTDEIEKRLFSFKEE